MIETSALLSRDVLPRALRRRHFAALAFGSIVGSAWVVVLGDWLNIAGPGGAVLGFIAGGIVIAIVGACYAELCSRYPAAGGEIVYTFEVFGPQLAFAVGWFSTLFFLAGGAFESIAISTLLSALLPKVNGPTLYQFLGHPITAGSLITGFTCGWGLVLLNVRGTAASAKLQLLLTALFVCLAAVFLLAGLGWGSITNVQPFLVTGTGHSWWAGALWIFATCPFWLNGFQAVPQAIEERAQGVSFRTIARVTVGSITAATLFYVGIVFAVSMAQPWQRSMREPLATAAALEAISPQGWLRQLVLAAAIFSLVKTWNGISLTTARLLLALGRARFVPPVLARLHSRYHSPYFALVLIGCVNSLAVLVGRGAVLPIVNMASMAVAFFFILCCAAIWKLRLLGSTRNQESHFAIPGGYLVLAVGLLGTTVMAAFALFEPAFHAWPRVSIEWKLLLLWSALGIVFWFVGRSYRGSLTPAELRQKLLGQVQPAHSI